MADTFTYADRLTVWCGEMSRAQALDCTRDFNAFIQTPYAPDKDQLAQEINYLFCRHAPYRVTLDHVELDDGSYTFEVNGQEVRLDLPLTRQCFNALPLSLALGWSELAEAHNTVLTSRFISGLERLSVSMRNSAAPLESAR